VLSVDIGEEDEEGFLDWAIRMQDAGAQMIDLMQQVGTSADRMTNELEITSDRIHSAGSDFRRARAVVRRLSARVEEHAQDIRSCASQTQTQWESFYESYRPFVSLESEDVYRWITAPGQPDEYVRQAIDAATTFETVTEQIRSLSAQVEQARMNIIQLRGVDRSLNRAIRNLDRAYAHLIDILDGMRSDMAELGRLSRSVPDTLADAALAIHPETDN
jgi:hypothetical protein